MTLVGKIFTVLILLMSVVFMTAATMVFATHKNWKDAIKDPTTGYEAIVKRLQEQIKSLEIRGQELKNALALEQASRRAATGAMQSKLTQMTAELSSKEKELQDLTSAHANSTEAEKLAQQRLKTIEDEITKVRGEVRDTQADRDAQFDKVVALTDQLHQAELVKKNLSERQLQLIDQVAQMKIVMDAHGLKIDSLVSHIPPRLDGIVVEVSDKDLIEISLGSDDGLKEGHTLEVYRGNQYLGRVVIKKTGPDRAVGQIKKELQRGPIKKGDNVTTKLS